MLALTLSFAAAFAQVPTSAQSEGPLEFTVEIAAGGEAAASELLLVANAKHIRVHTEVSGIEFYGVVKVRNASGRLTSNTIKKPYGAAGVYPAAADDYWSPLPASTLVWNTYANVNVDSLVVYNTSGAAGDVTFQLLLED